MYSYQSLIGISSHNSAILPSLSHNGYEYHVIILKRDCVSTSMSCLFLLLFCVFLTSLFLWFGIFPILIDKHLFSYKIDGFLIFDMFFILPLHYQIVFVQERACTAFPLMTQWDSSWSNDVLMMHGASWKQIKTKIIYIKITYLVQRSPHNFHNI